VDLPSTKETWLAALAQAEAFARERPPEESGCLYYAADRRSFVVPDGRISLAEQRIVPHWGAPGGVVPRISDARVEGTEP
jgi:hypothetical protein